MAQKYYNVKETAKLLHVAEDEVRRMLEHRELYGYRDGADWKFKVEEIERIAKDRAAAAPPDEPMSEDDGGDVLLSEIELGRSDAGLSGTVIGGELAKKATAAESDIQLANSDVKLVESDIQLANSDIKPAQPAKASTPAPKDDMGSKLSQFEELDLTLDQDLTLDDSNVASQPAKKPAAGDSAVDLTGKSLDDDDLVLGGSGTGSDITIGGDSGISLVDPADSGLSLEEPLNLTGGGDESLELGEDDLLTLSSDTATGAKLKGEDDFQLTPMEEPFDADDSESGSQVIALDTEGEDEGAATMIGTAGSVAAMLDEDDMGVPSAMGLGGMPMGSPAMGDMALEAEQGGLVVGAPLMQPVASLPEAPYTVWQILGLFACTLVLIPIGMMMYDLMRHMWTWDSPVHPMNSGLMDTIVNLFDK